MAWYRCMGGSGLPAGLQTDMDAVLNKKFSTSTTYPPADWPDTINLMGPLPERTASGAIANIQDGASEVPIKNWLVTLPASLSGYSSINGTKNTGTGTPETQYTASLGRTIYGGQADIVNGEGSEEYARVNLGSLTWTKVTSGQAPYFASSALNPAYKYVNNNPNAICSDYTQASIGGSGTANGFFITDGSSIRIRDDNHSSETGTEFKASMSGKYLTYELATPTDFTFTPITPTPETENVCNFWADEGDSSVMYRADIDLLLGGN